MILGDVVDLCDTTGRSGSDSISGLRISVRSSRRSHIPSDTTRDTIPVADVVYDMATTTTGGGELVGILHTHSYVWCGKDSPLEHTIPETTRCYQL